MKRILSIGLLALVASGQTYATCGPIMTSPLSVSQSLIVDLPFTDVSAPHWQADTVYQAGEIVLHTDGAYQARWWTQNEAPGPSWASWQLMTRSHDQWRENAVYTQGDKVLFAGEIYQAQYWNQGEKPSNLGAWSVTAASNKMQAAAFEQISYNCGTAPIWKPDGSYFYQRHYAKFVTLADEITNKVVFDHVRLNKRGIISQSQVGAYINGERCVGQTACNALLAGQTQPVSYDNVLIDSYTITNGTPYVPTPVPFAFADFCSVDNVCRRVTF